MMKRQHNELERLFNDFEKNELTFAINGWHVLIAVIIFVTCLMTVGHMENARDYQFNVPPVHVEKVVIP